MSDFVATLVIHGREYDLVAWDRPVWFAKGDIEGFRIVPDTQLQVTDALAAFALGAFDAFQGTEGKPVDVVELKEALDLDQIRTQVRAMDTLGIELILHDGVSGSEFVAELELFENPIKVTRKH